MKILLQAGHEGRTSGATGAPNEMSFNIDICNKVADELRLRGFEVKRVNADPKPEEIAGDWDLFLAIHYDADIYGTGGFFTDHPEPSTDGVTKRSQEIAYLLRQEYGGTTKIVHHPERSNEKTRYYYMWKKLSWNTPCVLIECGVGMHVPDDHEILHFNRPLVVEGIVKGICLAFKVPYEVVIHTEPPVVNPEPPVTPEPVVDPCKALKEEIENYRIYCVSLENSNNKLKELLNKINGIVFGKWTWVGITNGWKVRLNQLKELLG